MRCIFPVVAAATLLLGCSSPTIEPVELGDAAPDFLLNNLDAQAVASSALQGDVIVLNFWSTSCANCIAEIEELKHIHDSGKATVVGVALDEDPERIRSLVEAKGVEYQILVGDQETFERFDGFTIPYTLVLDQSRKVRKKFYGPMTEAQFEEVLAGI
jgi:peroxiredoxin